MKFQGKVGIVLLRAFFRPLSLRGLKTVMVKQVAVRDENEKCSLMIGSRSTTWTCCQIHKVSPINSMDLSWLLSHWCVSLHVMQSAMGASFSRNAAADFCKY